MAKISTFTHLGTSHILEPHTITNAGQNSPLNISNTSNHLTIRPSNLHISDSFKFAKSVISSTALHFSRQSLHTLHTRLTLHIQDHNRTIRLSCPPSRLSDPVRGVRSKQSILYVQIQHAGKGSSPPEAPTRLTDSTTAKGLLRSICRSQDGKASEPAS